MTRLTKGGGVDVDPVIVYNSDGGDGYTAFKTVMDDYWMGITLRSSADNATGVRDFYTVIGQVKVGMDDLWQLQWYDGQRAIAYEVAPDGLVNMTSTKKWCSRDEVAATQSWLGLGTSGCADEDACDYTDPYATTCVVPMAYKNTWARVRNIIGMRGGEECDDS